MKKRIPYFLLFICAITAWWISDHIVIPWIQQVAGYNSIPNKDLSVLLGHWVFGQLPRVIICIVIWLMATRYGLMPSIYESLKSGGSWRRTLTTGFKAGIVLLILTFSVGAAAGGKFGFNPYFTKMLGDLISNMYEEIVYRGLMFCAIYGVVSQERFPLIGSVNRTGIILGTIGSSIIFAAGHDQYSIALRIVIGIFSSVFVYPWVISRSLWAPWISHMIVDMIGDSFLKL